MSNPFEDKLSGPNFSLEIEDYGETMSPDLDLSDQMLSDLDISGLPSSLAEDIHFEDSIGLTSEESKIKEASDVEKRILKLLQKGSKNFLIQTFLGGLNSLEAKKLRDDFARATLTNPALSYYPRLLSICPDCLQTDGEDLDISVKKSFFEKQIKPSLYSFKPEFVEVSPLVKAVLDLAGLFSEGSSVEEDFFEDSLSNAGIEDTSGEYLDSLLFEKTPSNDLPSDLAEDISITPISTNDVVDPRPFEDFILQLIAEKQYQEVLDVFNSVSPNPRSDMSGACSRNPALLWYPKLLQILPEGSLSYIDGELVVKITPTQFKMIIKPFLSSFKEEFRASSPIVSAILNLNDIILERDLEKGLDVLNTGVVERTLEPERDGNFDPSNVEYSLDDVLSSGETDAKASSIITTDLFGNEEFAPDYDNLPVPGQIDEYKFEEQLDKEFGLGLAHSFDLSLSDYSNKRIADILKSRGLDFDSAAKFLKTQGFEKPRAHEILAIFSYKG